MNECCAAGTGQTGGVTRAWKAAVVVALVTAACTGDGHDPAEAAVEPIGPGVVTVPEWFEDPEVVGVARSRGPRRYPATAARVSSRSNPTVAQATPTGG